MQSVNYRYMELVLGIYLSANEFYPQIHKQLQ